MGDVTTPPPNPPLRRRNSIATSVAVPAKLSLPTKPLHTSSLPTTTAAAASTTTSSSSTSSSQSFPTVDFELISIKPFSYTSLKDLLPSTGVQSPTTSAGGGGQSACEISIRNRLVKQAAWAYLQPMSTSPDSEGGGFLRRLWARFSGNALKNPFSALLHFIDGRIIRGITQAFDWLLRAIRIRSSR